MTHKCYFLQHCLDKGVVVGNKIVPRESKFITEEYHKRSLK